MVTPNAETIRAKLRENFLFETLDDHQISVLMDKVWLEEIPEGSVIVREGDEADALYVVMAGGVNVTKRGGQFLAFLGPGGFFGEMALFSEGAKRTATCTSTSDTTCVIVRKPVLHQYCEDNPLAGLKIYRAIIRTLAERLQNTSADLAFLMGAQVRSQSKISNIVESSKAKPQKK